MNKKIVFLCLLVLSIFIVSFIITISYGIKYNKLIIDDKMWKIIISNNYVSNDIKIEKISFNDYDLVIDEQNSIIYYSMIDNMDMNNPKVKYKTNNRRLKIAVNSKMVDGFMQQNKTYKMMLYGDNKYREYTLVLTHYPVLNVICNEKIEENSKVDISFKLFDNNTKSSQRIFNSNGKLMMVEEYKIYKINLTQQSIGNNKRKNFISIFGQSKDNEYLIKSATPTNNDDNYVLFLINNNNMGIYLIEPQN